MVKFGLNELEKLDLNEFLERVKKRESVSRYEFSLGFKWGVEESAKLREVLKNVKNANLRSANLFSVDLSSVVLRRADLSFADLQYAKLRCADLQYADLDFSNLLAADLEGAKLNYASLQNINLESANLRNASLNFADLNYAHLNFANLENVNLTRANLNCASLINADIAKANFKDVDFSEGFAFKLPCGRSFAKLIASLRNASEKLKQYLFLQSIVFISANRRNEKPFDYIREWFELPEFKKIIKIKDGLNEK